MEITLFYGGRSGIKIDLYKVLFQSFRDPCVTYFGVTLMTEEAGEFRRVVLDTPLAKIFRRHSTIRMV